MPLWNEMGRTSLVLLLGLGLASCQDDERERAGHESSRAPRVKSDVQAITFRKFHLPQDCERIFRNLADWRPRWFRTGSLGRSYLGRPIPYLAISDFSSDQPKAGYWIDGAIHGGEVESAEPVMAVAEALRKQIASNQPSAYLRKVVIYLVPAINVDGRQASLTRPYPPQRKNLRPVDDDGDGRFDEDGPVDMNGDGHVAFVPQIGGLECRDVDGDGRYGEDPPGGVDLNRNFPVRSYTANGRELPEHVPSTVEPETRAVMRFWKAHSEIQLAVSYHSSANLFIRPVGVSKRDAPLYDAILNRYREVIGGKEWSIPDVSLDALRGLTMEWFYKERNALAFTIEIEPEDKSMRHDISWGKRTGEDHLSIKGRGRVFVPRFAQPLEVTLSELLERHARFLLKLAEMLPLERRKS